MPSARTLQSIARTVAYGAVGLLLWLAPPGRGWEAVLWGGMLADYATWLVRSLVLLPQDVWHGSYEALVNLFVGWLVFRLSFPDVGLEGEALFAGFLAFLTVGTAKLLFYGVAFFGSDGE